MNKFFRFQDFRSFNRSDAEHHIRNGRHVVSTNMQKRCERVLNRLCALSHASLSKVQEAVNGHYQAHYSVLDVRTALVILSEKGLCHTENQEWHASPKAKELWKKAEKRHHKEPK